MRKTMHLLRNFLNDGSRSSGSPVLPRGERQWSISPLRVLRSASGFGLSFCVYKWVDMHGGNIYEDWKTKKKTREILERLEREKHGSPEAFLETVAREIEALKPNLSKGEVRSCEVQNYEREVAFLKEVIAWAQKDIKKAENAELLD